MGFLEGGGGGLKPCEILFYVFIPFIMDLDLLNNNLVGFF